MPPRHRTSNDLGLTLSRLAPALARWIERTLAAHDPPLTAAQFETLRAIGGGGAVASELARAAGISQPAVSQVVTAMERAGLVARGDRDPEDRRRQALALTPAGQEALRSAERLVAGRLGALLADLPGPEVDALGHLFARVADALAGVPPPRPHHPRRPPGPPGPPPRPPGGR